MAKVLEENALLPGVQNSSEMIRSFFLLKKKALERSHACAHMMCCEHSIGTCRVGSSLFPFESSCIFP